MRLTICLTAAVALCACSKPAESPPATENAAQNVAEANSAAAATPTAMQINETSWTYTNKDGTKVQESVDASGKYVSTSTAGKHIDHGKAWVQDDKVCFDSAMDKEGESCWTAKQTEIGQSTEVTSDKGEKLTVTRIAYVPPSPM